MKIYTEIKKYYKYGVFSFLLIIVIQLLALIPPIFMKKIVDIYIPNYDLKNIYIAIIVLGAIPLVSTLINVAFNYYLTINVRRLAFDIKQKIVHNILHQPINFFSKYTTGELIEYSGRDVTEFIYFWLMDFPTSISNVLMAIILSAILLSLNSKITLIQLISIPIIVFPTKCFGRQVKKYSANIIKGNAEIKQIMSESFRGIKTIKIFGLQGQRMDKMRNAFNSTVKCFAKMAMLDRLYGEWTQQFIVVIFTSISFALCAIEVINKKMTIGSMIIYITYLPMVYKYITQTSLMNLKFNKQLGEFSNQFEFLNLSSTEDDNCHKTEEEEGLNGKVEFRNVSFKYPNTDKYVLRNLSFSVEAGEFIGITGANGTGKSTIFNLIYKFYDEYEGEIYIDNMNIKYISNRLLFKNISLVSQDVFLFSGTLRENFLMANPKITNHDINSAIKLTNLNEWIDTLPNGLDTELEENGANLSGGQRQRIAMAMGLLKGSKILLLDEVTSSLDSESEAIIRETLNSLTLREGLTILAISHRKDLLKNVSNTIKL